MKVNKNQLKAIVKECLLEILNEGLGGSLSVEPGISRQQSRQTMADSSRRNGTTLPERRVVSNTSAQQSIVKAAAGGNPLLESIFADTMQTTYRDMAAHGDASPYEQQGPSLMPKTGYARVVDESTPEQLFGEEAASKWLAIMDRVGND